jgi:hypothetical protein
MAAGLTLIFFLLFFGLICPVGLYWFNRFLRKAWTHRNGFIGFPQDSEPPESRD